MRQVNSQGLMAGRGIRAVAFATLAAATALLAAAPARAGNEFENAFEDQSGRSLAHEAAAVGRSILAGGYYPVAGPAYYAPVAGPAYYGPSYGAFYGPRYGVRYRDDGHGHRHHGHYCNSSHGHGKDSGYDRHRGYRSHAYADDRGHGRARPPARPGCSRDGGQPQQQPDLGGDAPSRDQRRGFLMRRTRWCAALAALCLDPGTARRWRSAARIAGLTPLSSPTCSGPARPTPSSRVRSLPVAVAAARASAPAPSAPCSRARLFGISPRDRRHQLPLLRLWPII
jgi:hypothetical protein